jgi:agmatinase
VPSKVDPTRFDPEGAGDDRDGVFGLPLAESECSVVLVPVPWEPTTSYKRGAAHGPGAIRRASPQLDLFDAELAAFGLGAPWAYGIHMRHEDPEVVRWNIEACRNAEPVIKRGGRVAGDDALAQAVRRVDELTAQLDAWLRARASELLDAGKIVGTVGGDHSASFGAIAAHLERWPDLGILHVDAHADLRKAYEGFRGSHASIMRNVIDELPIARIVQVGVRDQSREEHALSLADPRIVPWPEHTLRTRLDAGETWAALRAEIVAGLPERVYVSFDIDGLDPTLCPSTGTPVPGGLSFAQASTLLLELVRQGKTVVGFDLVEVAPSGRPGDEWDGNVGARILYKLCGVALHGRGARD